MIQRCPKCGEWCMPSELSALDRAICSGAESVSSHSDFGGAIGGLFGKTGKKIGETLGTATAMYNPLNYIKAGAEAVLGDKYMFCCSNCGNEWSADNEDEDQTEEYEAWKLEQEWKEGICELIENTVTLVNENQSQKQNHIKALQSALSSEYIEESNAIKGGIYDALAYSYLVFSDDRRSALEFIHKSLELYPEDHVSLSIKGMIRPETDSPLDSYETMKYLINYKDIDTESAYSHFTITQFEERFNKTANTYVTRFLDIPQNSRRFLVIDDKFSILPDSFIVLPQNYIPQNLCFPSGHPQLHQLYVVHPYKSDEYIPYTDYQLSLFRDELREFSWIMECLGAKSISFTESQTEEKNAEKQRTANTRGDASYGGYTAQGSYERGGATSEYLKLTSELLESKEYDITPNTLPYIPKDIVWYQHRPEWHRNCESRKVGRLLKASFKLSTSNISATSAQERKKIEADLQILLFKANGNHELEEKVSLRSEENHTWAVDVEFYPLSEYNGKQKVNTTETTPIQVTPTTIVSSPGGKLKVNSIMYAMLGVIIILIFIITMLVL